MSRTAFLLYILFLQLASAHHLLADPGIYPNWKIFNTSYAMYLAVLAPWCTALTVPGAIEVAQRKKGYTQGLFEWLRKAPWGNLVLAAMFISLVGFGFLGGISGVMMGTEQLNLSSTTRSTCRDTSTPPWWSARRSPSWGLPTS